MAVSFIAFPSGAPTCCLFRFCRAPEHREAGPAAGMGGHHLLAAGRAQTGVPRVLYRQHGSHLGVVRQARSTCMIVTSRCWLRFLGPHLSIVQMQVDLSNQRIK